MYGLPICDCGCCRTGCCYCDKGCTSRDAQPIDDDGSLPEDYLITRG